MTFEQAVREAKAGRKVRRSSWAKTFVVLGDDGKLWVYGPNGREHWKAGQTTMQANDWEALPGEPPDPAIKTADRKVEALAEELSALIMKTPFMPEVVGKARKRLMSARMQLSRALDALRGPGRLQVWMEGGKNEDYWRSRLVHACITGLRFNQDSLIAIQIDDEHWYEFCIRKMTREVVDMDATLAPEGQKVEGRFEVIEGEEVKR